jgi:hydroxylaminobenzene mutase
VQPTQVTRHPLDPDPIRSTKAGAVFGLGLAGAVAGLFVGGIVPATIALLLARQARREAYASGGYLTGSEWIRRGERLAWIGVMLCLVTVVVATVIGILHWTGGVQDYAPGVD